MPLILKLQPLPGTVVSVWKITEGEEFFTSQLQLSETENQYLQAIRHQSKRLQWLSSRLMIRKHLDTDKVIEMKYQERGQPQLVNFTHHISISHTDDVSAVIVSHDKRSGVDIEQLFRSVEIVAHKFISPKEKSQFNRAITVEEMLFIWSAKEALYKYYGGGQVDFKKHLYVKIPASISEGVTEGSIKKDNFSAEVKINYRKIDGEYLLCWIVE